MQDFILCSPFNGFPFVLEKEVVETENYHTWNINLEEAMKLYWFSNICDIDISLNFYIAESGSAPVNIIKNFSTNCYESFMSYFSPVPSEAYLRARSNSSVYMYTFFEEDGLNQFLFHISTPLYQGKDSYLIKFWGSYSFDYDGYGFELHIGLSDLETSYLRKFDFALSIFDKDIPCILVQTYGKAGEDNIVISATASISSSYIN